MRSYSYAGFWVRLCAYLIDSILIGVGLLAVRFGLFLSFGLFGAQNPLDFTFLFQYTWKDALLYAAGAAYFVLCTYYAGATLGKKALNLQVVSADGGKLSFLDVLYRETVGRFLSAAVLGIGYLLAGITAEKKGLHDMLCDTRVVYGKKIPSYQSGDFGRQYEYRQEPQPARAADESEKSGIQEHCGQGSKNETVSVQRTEPTRVIETPNRKISIYERYEHIEHPEEDNRKE